VDITIQQIQIWVRSIQMENNNEKELENNFILQYAATMESPDDMGESGSGVSEKDMKDAGDILSKVSEDAESPPEGEESKENDDSGLFGEKTDSAQAEIEASEDVIPWLKFKIILDTRYLEEVKNSYAGQLDDEEIQKKAEAQSYYIRCAQGNKRVEGIWNRKLIGGYGTKEKLGEDLNWMKKMTVAEGQNPETSKGFPKAESGDILKDMEEPVVATDEVKKEIEQQSGAGAEEANKQDTTQAVNPTPEPSIPQPVGKASTEEISAAANVKELEKRRILRAELLKKI